MDARDVLRRFDALCALVTAQGSGITYRQLADAHALARQLEAAEPDRGRVADLAAGLGIDPSMVAGR